MQEEEIEVETTFKADDEFIEITDVFGRRAYEKRKRDENGCCSRWVRLEKGEDPVFNSLKSKEDILEAIQNARREQSRLGTAHLYSRCWNFRSGMASESGEKQQNESESCITVMQWNILAEGLSAGGSVQSPFRREESVGSIEEYGGFTSLPNPSVSLDFSRRRWRILEVLLGSDGSAPFDVVALEEVDRYQGFFAPALRLYGYDGIFIPKVKAPGVPMGWYSDGCCLFWKTSIFESRSEYRVEYTVGNQVALIVSLWHKASNKNILVAATHLKASNSEASENVRCFQVDELADHLQDVNSGLQKDAKTPIIILGDFNAEPHSEGLFKESAIGKLLQRRDHQGRQLFKSAYDIDLVPNHFYTTWKIRGEKAVRRVIDYIFYGEGLECLATLDAPLDNEVEDSRLPGLRYPSDHLMIASKFEIK